MLFRSPALTAAKMCSVNKNTTHCIYTLLQARVMELAEVVARPLVSDIVEKDESYLTDLEKRLRKIKALNKLFG